MVGMAQRTAEDGEGGTEDSSNRIVGMVQRTSETGLWGWYRGHQRQDCGDGTAESTGW